jgi:hypothetical protein
MLLELDPQQLRELAAARERLSPKMQAHRRLDDEGREALFGILVRGDRPTIGWWRRQFERISETSDSDATS